MAKKVRYEPSRKGMREMMKWHEMQDLMLWHANTVANEANLISGDSYEDFFDWLGEPLYDVGPISEPVKGIVSAHAFVRTANLAARIDQAKNDTLNHAL